MRTSFDEYVREHAGQLLRFAYLLSGDRHLAEDILQEVLARCYRRWARITAAGSPDAYLRRSLLHEYLSWRRRRASTETVLAHLPEPAAAGEVGELVARREELWMLLDELPRPQRAVLVMRYYLDLPDAEIAGLLGCAPTTVRVHAFRALARLRTKLTSPAYLEACRG